jgi:hypothetical protein
MLGKATARARKPRKGREGGKEYTIQASMEERNGDYAGQIVSAQVTCSPFLDCGKSPMWTKIRVC